MEQGGNRPRNTRNPVSNYKIARSAAVTADFGITPAEVLQLLADVPAQRLPSLLREVRRVARARGIRC